MLGSNPETAFGPAGLGDLYVTATSPLGRNRRMGEKLGTGLNLDQALREMIMVAEGVRAAACSSVAPKMMTSRCPS